MKNINHNISGILIFIFGGLLGHIIFIIRGSHSNDPIYLTVTVVSFVIGLILCLMGIYKLLKEIKPNLIKIFLLMITAVLTCIELLICYILLFIIAISIVGPIMARLGYHVVFL